MEVFLPSSPQTGDLEMRTLVAWCPDWPVTAAGFGPSDLAAVIEKGRIVATSHAARLVGVQIGLKRREAETRCPGITILPKDPALEARMFEPVVAAVAEFTPLVEVSRAGLVALDARGPTRYFGGEESLCRQVQIAAREAVPKNSPRPYVGIASGRFAAVLAARQAMVVPVGQNSQFLSSFPLSVLNQYLSNQSLAKQGTSFKSDLIGLLLRLGIHTLGDFAQLSQSSVLMRFGKEALFMHALAQGHDQESLNTQPPPKEISASINLDPPVEKAETAVFVARSLAEDLLSQLRDGGLICARLQIEAESEHGEFLSRLWRSEEGFDAGSIVDRLRWQLDGWLSGTSVEAAPTSGLTRLVLKVDEVLTAGGYQLGLWGEVSGAELRAAKGLDRLRAVLGPNAIARAILQGGRSPRDRVAIVPWGEPKAKRSEDLPWPGHHPLPTPTRVYPSAVPIQIRDCEGKSITISARAQPSSAPTQISIDGGPWTNIVSWGGPWTTDERWWDQAMHRRQARFQILTGNLGAHLCVVEEGRWWIEASYD